MTKKCTGCKIFSMCLGDPASLIETQTVYQCRYCGGYVMGRGRQLPRASLCGEFITYAKSYGHANYIQKMVCDYPACEERSCESARYKDI